ncbi:MAG: hypothetical protein Q4G11_01160 [Gallicola sp.]|nr:hypothetical protein [Gallicola sp.]
MILFYDFEDVVLEVETQGGCIESLTDGVRNILYPRGTIEIDGQEKKRGGSHPCVPNFGIDTTYALPPHGFGRDEKWDVMNKAPSYSTLSLEGKGDFKNLKMLLSYEIGEHNLRMNLQLKNAGDTILPIAPGFHPYFPTKDSYIKIHNRELNKNEQMVTTFFDGDVLEFETAEMAFKFETKNCNRFAVWSDSEDYVCVEPTLNGPSFSEIVETPYELKPDEEFEMDAVLEWKVKG